jgi:hypothetical protein
MTAMIREKCKTLPTMLVSLEDIKLVELKRSDELVGVRAASAESRTQPPPHMSGQFHFRNAFCLSGFSACWDSGDQTLH